MIRRLVSIVVAAAVVVAGVVVFRSVRPEPEVYTLTADVVQAPNLFEDGRVMVRGVEVGRITEVEPRPDAVRITMEIDAGTKIPSDARLTVVPITVIADRYVQLSPPYTSGSTLEDGDHISIDRTQIPAELDDVLTQLKGLLAALEPEPGAKRGPLFRLIRNLDAVMKGRSDEFAGSLEGSAEVLENLAASEADIAGLVRNLDRLFVVLANRSSEIGLLNERLALVAESLQGDQANLEATIENLSFLADESARLVIDSGDELGEDFGRLKRVLNGVLQHQDDLMEVVRWTNVIAQSLGAISPGGRGRFAYTGLQVEPGAAGAEYNYRIETRDTVGCQRINAISQALLELNPNAGLEQLRESVLQRIADSYQDDLSYLIEALIPLCVDFDETGQLDANTAKVIEDVAAKVGKEQLEEMLVRWLIEGYAAQGARP
jgi:phospholipid/cholesterol/gamma-HCH transport system substrate-binding protein